MEGITGLLLAIALSTPCTITELQSDAVILECRDTQKFELVIPRHQWPHEWREPALKNVYQLNAQGEAIMSEEDLAARVAAREKMLREMNRWRRHRLQQPIVP